MGSSKAATANTEYELASRTTGGTTTVYASFVPEDTTNYNSLGSSTSYNKTASATVNKANGSCTVSLDDWTYGSPKNPSASSTTNSGATVTYTYYNSSEVSIGSTKPTTVGTYYVTATFAATTNYNACTSSKDKFVISKATPTLTLTGTTITYDGSSTATVKANASVAGVIYYGTSTSMGSSKSASANTEYTLATRTDAGTTTVYAAFVPTDATNYNSLGSSSSYNKSASAKVNATSSTLTLTANKKIYNGTTYYVSATSTLAGTVYYGTSSGSMTNTKSITAGGTISLDASGCGRSSAGSTTIYAYLDPTSSNYNNSSTVNAKVTINKAVPTMRLAGSDKIYDGKAAYITGTASVAGKIYYGTTSDTSGMSTAVSVSANTATNLTSITNAGTLTVYAYFVPTDTTNYHSLGSSSDDYVSKSITISKATPTMKLSGSDKTYNGSASYIAGTASVAGTIYYGTTSATSGMTSTKAVSANTATNLTSRTNAGTLTVYAYFVPTDTTNYNSLGSSSNDHASKSITISKANGSGSISMTGWTYGNAVTNPTVTSNPNNASVTYEWYPEDGLPAGTISKPGSTSDAGTYTVRAIFGETSNHKSYTTSLVSFNISKRPVTFTATTQGKNYDGTALYVSNTASLTSGSLVSGHTATTFNCSGTARTDVGRNTKYLNSVTIKSGSTDVTSNYNITKKSGYIQIYGARLTFYNRGCGAYCSFRLDKYSGGKWTNNFVHCNSTTSKNATYGPFNFAPSDKIYVWPGNDGIYGESTMIVASHGITQDVYGGTMYFTDLNLDGANPVNGTNGHIEYTVPYFMVEGDDPSYIYFSPTSGGFIMTGSVGIGHNENESSTNPPYNPPTYDSDAY